MTQKELNDMARDIEERAVKVAIDIMNTKASEVNDAQTVTIKCYYNETITALRNMKMLMMWYDN